MRSLLKINLILVTLLSVAAGIPKLMRIPREVDFFADAGLGELSVVALGLLQLSAGILLAFRQTRLIGASIASIAFLISTVLLFLAGDIVLGLVFLVPVLMADIVIFNCIRKGSAMSSSADPG